MDFDDLRDAAQHTVLALPHGLCGPGKLMIHRRGIGTGNANCEPDLAVVDGMNLTVVQAKAIAAARGSRVDAARFAEHFFAEASRQAEGNADLQDGFGASLIIATSTLDVGVDLTDLVAIALPKPPSQHFQQMVGRGLRGSTNNGTPHCFERPRTVERADTVLLHLQSSKLPGGNLIPLTLPAGLQQQQGRLGRYSLVALLTARTRPSSGESLLDFKAALWQRQLESAYLLLRSRYTKSAQLFPPGNIVAGPSGFGNGSETDRFTAACGLTRLSMPLIPRAPGTTASGAGAPGRAAWERAARNPRGHRFSLAA